MPSLTALSPTLTRIHLAPSYPVHIARGALLSLTSTNVQGLSITNNYLHPLTRILQGFHRFRFETLESTVPATVLISSSSNASSNASRSQSLHSHILNLDGTHDWAILPRDAILAWSGASLRIDTLPLPSTVHTRVKWYQFFQSRVKKTGLAAPLKPGYSLISGRGEVVVRGEGEIIPVELHAEEEFLVKRANVVGISVQNPDVDLAESAEEYQLKKFIPDEAAVAAEQSLDLESIMKAAEKEKKIETETDTEAVSVTDVVKKDPLLQQIKHTWNTIKSQTNKFVKFVNDSLPSNDEYIKISGPRTVLVKTHQVSQPTFLQLKEEESILKQQQQQQQQQQS
jgi:hypothetical protein